MDGKIPMGLRFSLLHRAFQRRMDDLLREMGLTGVQFGVLGELGRLEAQGCERINQRALENASHVTHPTMTDIIKRLEQKGFIVCRPDPEDRRNKSISSTEKACRLHREIDRLDREVFDWLCAGLSESEVEQLLSCTDRMLSNVFETYRRSCGSHPPQDS